MDRVSVTIITGEGVLFSGEADIVLAPGVEGQLGIPPHHTPLITALDIGELKIRMGEREESFAIHGGFMEVRPHKVTVLADIAERAEEIDVERAQAARERAQKLLREGVLPVDTSVQEALRRSTTRLRVARGRRRRTRDNPPPGRGDRSSAPRGHY